eukprot:ANDGO_06213.mRNA.1 Nucleoid-associated protein GbCGDNIH1_0260
MVDWKSLVSGASQLKQLGQMQSALSGISALGEAGVGAVKVTLNGLYQLKKVEIDPAIMKRGDPIIVSDLVVAAHKDAMTKVSQETMKIAQQFAQSQKPS